MDEPDGAVCFHVILRVEPTPQLIAVFGAVTVTVGVVVVVALIVKFTSLVSPADPSAAVTLIRACVVVGPETSQLYEPPVAEVFWTDAEIGDHDAPPSRLTSILTDDPLPRLWVQAIDFVELEAHVTALFGAVTEIAALGGGGGGVVPSVAIR